jgi:hypothetical protein
MSQNDSKSFFLSCDGGCKKNFHAPRQKKIIYYSVVIAALDDFWRHYDGFFRRRHALVAV